MPWILGSGGLSGKINLKDRPRIDFHWGKSYESAMGDEIKILNAAAFDVHTDCKCGDSTTGDAGKSIFCKQSDTCSNGNYCQLFERPKGSAKDVIWKVTALNKDHEAKNHPDKIEYTCLCVTPVLGATLGKFAVRYIPCNTGLCTQDEENPPMGGGKKYGCSGDCDDKKGCECTLFRLKVVLGAGEKDEVLEKAKWERVAGPGSMVAPENDYYYRCFCIKTA